MAKMIRYYLHIKDVMRAYVFVLEYDTMTELSFAYDRYINDYDYEVLLMYSVGIEVDIIMKKDFTDMIR